MIGDALKRNMTDRAFCHLIGPFPGHPKAMRPQVRVKGFGRQLGKVRRQPQTFKLALSLVFAIGHPHLQEDENDRTQSLVASVVYTTDLHLRVREGWTGRLAAKCVFETVCSGSPGISGNSA